MALALLGQLWAIPTAFGQDEVNPVVGLEFEIEEELLGAPWLDPIVAFGLENEPLAAEPEFDFATLHPSAVFEEGVESVAVREEPDITEQTERHMRSLQAVATAELALETAGQNIVGAEATIAAATNRIADARAEISVLDGELAQLQADNDQITSDDLDERNEQDHLRSQIDLVNAAIAEIAIATFIGADEALETLFQNPRESRAIERKIITDEVRDSQRADIARFEGLIRDSEQRRDVLAAELAEVLAATAARQSQVSRLNVEIEDLSEEREAQRRAIEGFQERQVVLTAAIEDSQAFTEVTAAHYQIAYHQRLGEFVAGTNVPLVALNAYVRASRTLAVENPGCGIHWSQLAGIGQIESIHGYFGESTLDINGNTTVDILGLALDGRVLSGGGTSEPLPDATNRTESTAGVSRLALIRDTDGGLLDGDPVFDRAVGPMQFIPSTWRLYDSDGNGDEENDPQNIYDASLASARLLCDSAGSMLTAAGEQRAYFAYNHDLSYSRNVTNAGRGYHNQLDPLPSQSGAFTAFAASGAAEALAAANIAAQRAADTPEIDVGIDPDPDGDDVGEGDSQGDEPSRSENPNAGTPDDPAANAS